MDKEQEILEKSTALFFKYGIRSMTMDEIANQLGISKKTLYQYFSNKAELIERIVRSYIEQEKSQCNALTTIEENDNAVEVMFKIYQMNYSRMSHMNTVLLFELKRYYSNIWSLFDNHKNKFIYSTVLENLKQGMKEGLYRNDLRPEIIAKIYTGRIDMIADGELFPLEEFNFKQTLNELFKYHIHGIATSKGIEILKKLDLNQTK